MDKAVMANISFLQRSVSQDKNQTSPAPQVKIPYFPFTFHIKSVSKFSQDYLGRCLTSGYSPPFSQAPSFSISLDFLTTFHVCP